MFISSHTKTKCCWPVTTKTKCCSGQTKCFWANFVAGDHVFWPGTLAVDPPSLDTSIPDRPTRTAPHPATPTTPATPATPATGDNFSLHFFFFYKNNFQSPESTIWVVHGRDPRPQFNEKTLGERRKERKWSGRKKKDIFGGLAKGGGGQKEKKGHEKEPLRGTTPRRPWRPRPS